MSVERVIPARRVDTDQVEAFPYFTAPYTLPLESLDGETDDPLGASLSTPEEDAKRLASVDQVIYEKLQEAERQAQDIARKGYEEGFASGEKEGRTFGESQYKAHLQRLDGHLEEISLSLSLNQQAAQEEVLALAMAMGEYLAGREIQEGTQTIRPFLENLLAARPFPAGPGEGPDPTAITVHLNPKDLDELGTASQYHTGVTLREDPELSRGSLRLESSIGVLDATLERRREMLMELLHAFREKAGP